MKYSPRPLRLLQLRPKKKNAAYKLGSSAVASTIALDVELNREPKEGAKGLTRPSVAAAHAKAVATVVK